MKKVSNAIDKLIQTSRWIAMVMSMFMMVFIFISVVARGFNFPILGDVELVQLSLVVMIMFGLSYAESENAHINIGLVVDRLPLRVQAALDILGNILVVVVSWVFAWVFYHSAMKEMTEQVIKSDLLSIPEFPFKFIIAIGTLLWGLVSLFKIISAVLKLITGNVEKTETNKEAEELWI